MVQQLFNEVERLKAEVKRLRGKLDSIAIGNQVILNPGAGSGNNPVPPATSGALIYGTAGAQWGRRSIGAEGDVLQVQSGFPVWDVPTASSLPTGGATGQALVKDSGADGDATWHDIEDLATADTDTSKVLKPNGTGGVAWGTGGSGAPTGAQYVTLALDAGLSAERVLVAGTGLSLTDGGANGNVTLATDPSELGGITKFIRKTADESVTTNTTVQNDDELLFALAANEVWAFRIYLRILSSTTADFKFSFAVPTGCGGDATAAIKDAGGTFGSYAGDISLFANLALAGFGTGATQQAPWVLDGVLVNGANAGNFQLQWAQNTSSGTTTLMANSYILAWRLA